MLLSLVAVIWSHLCDFSHAHLYIESVGKKCKCIRSPTYIAYAFAACNQVHIVHICMYTVSCLMYPYWTKGPKTKKPNEPLEYTDRTNAQATLYTHTKTIQFTIDVNLDRSVPHNLGWSVLSKYVYTRISKSLQIYRSKAKEWKQSNAKKS